MAKNDKLIIIDLYGMISTGSYKNTCRWVARKYGLNYKQVYDVVYHKYFTDAVNKKISEPQMFNRMARALKLKDSGKKLQKIHESYQLLNKSVLNFCLKLQNQGFRIVLLSKNTPGQLRYTTNKFKLKTKFPNIINTFDVNIPKSSARMMRWLSKKYKTPLKQIIFCDDQDFNLVEAKKLGVKTILYKNFTGFKKEIKKYLH